MWWCCCYLMESLYGIYGTFSELYTLGIKLHTFIGEWIVEHDDRALTMIDHHFSKKSGSLDIRIPSTIADAKGRKASCQLTCCRLPSSSIVATLESVAMLWSGVLSLWDKRMIYWWLNVILCKEKLHRHRVTANLSKYKPLMKGYDYDASDATS